MVAFVNCDDINSRCKNHTVGYYPKCHCEDGYAYQLATGTCEMTCPTISEDDGYPNCWCRYGDEYDNSTNSCPNPKCPNLSTNDSVYPNCKCTGKNYVYNEYFNECFLICPEDSTGYYPDCKCDDPKKRFSKGKKRINNL